MVVLIGFTICQSIAAGGSTTSVVTGTTLVPPTAHFIASITSGNTPLAVSFMDVSTGSPTNWNWSFGDGIFDNNENPVHVYTFPGIFTVSLNASNNGGSNISEITNYIVVTSPPPPPPPPTPSPSPSPTIPTPSGGGSGGGSSGKPPSGQQGAPPAQGGAPKEENGAEGPPEGNQISETNELTSQGVSVATNQQGQQTLSIDRTTAEKAGATVVVSDKSIDITQPGFTLNIVAEHVEEKNGVVKGDNIQSISLSTTPLEASIPEVGTVAGSVQAGLTSLPQGASITTTISEKATPEAQSAFQIAAANTGKEIQSIAYTMSITKTNIQATLPAIIRMSAPQDWVNNNGGINAVSIVRYGDDKSVSVLETSFIGIDEKGNMAFEAKSPAGLSIFGLLTAKATAAKQQEGVTVQQLQKPAILTEMGMFGWISTLLIQNPIVLVILTGLLIVSVYFGWWKRRI